VEINRRLFGSWTRFGDACTSPPVVGLLGLVSGGQLSLPGVIRRVHVWKASQRFIQHPLRTVSIAVIGPLKPKGPSSKAPDCIPIVSSFGFWGLNRRRRKTHDSCFFP